MTCSDSEIRYGMCMVFGLYTLPCLIEWPNVNFSKEVESGTGKEGIEVKRGEEVME